MTTVEDMHEYLVDNDIATDEEVCLVADVAGYSEETMEAILYSRTGEQAFYDLEEDEEDEEDE